MARHITRRISKNFKYLMFLGALTIGWITFAQAETTIVRETTVVEPLPPPVATTTTITTRTTTTPGVFAGTRPIVIEDLDLNHDLMLTSAEVGDVLFKLYDTDGNMVIDNVEYERPALLTLSPVLRATRVSYDFDNDGIADRSVVSYNTFLQRTMLSRFDRNGNGLSAHEFTGKSFLVADVDNSKAIEKREWLGTYIGSIDRRNRADAALND